MSKNKKMGVSKMQHAEVLKVLHPRRPPEIYRQPITAGEIMKKHPRYCIARPDVFQFPWIVVHPNSVLVPGKTFYLVPYTTLDKLMKEKRKQLQTLFSPEKNQSSTNFNHRSLDYIQQNSPTKALAGVTPPKKGRRLHDDECYYAEGTREEDSDADYKEDFRSEWIKLRESLQRTKHESGDQVALGLDSPLDIRPRPHVESFERELVRVKSCLRKEDSERKKLKLKVRFVSAVVIPRSQRVSPNDDHLVLQV